MPDDPTRPPDWQRDNKGRARKPFGKLETGNEKPDPGKKQEPVSPHIPTHPERPVLHLHPKWGLRRFQDNSGRPDPSAKPAKPRRHTKEQIEEWALMRRTELQAKHDSMARVMKERHEFEKKKVLAKYKEAVTGKDSESLKHTTDRQAKENQQLAARVTQEQFNLKALIASSHEKGFIMDRDYLDERSRLEKDMEDIERSTDAPEHNIGHDTGRTDDGGGRSR